MKRLITSIIVCFVAIAAMAQNKADIEVSYYEISYFENGVERDNRYHLIANTSQSKFFNPHSEEIDSLTSSPEGLSNFKKAKEASFQAMIAQGSIDMKKLPRKKEKLYVVKSASESTITVYDMIGVDERVYYTEPYDDMVWEIGDSTRTILGYDCTMANTDYHGRHWTAWFSPEIPIQDGPWKFHGLPGLILEASSSDGEYGYVADGIEKSERIITGVYGAEQYEKRSRKDILRDKRAIRDNPMGRLSAKGIKAQIISEPITDNPKSTDFIETDYR